MTTSNTASSLPLSPSTATSGTSALMEITARPQPVMVRGSGSYLWDNHQRRYLDFIQGWAVNALGHSPTQIVDALNAQSQVLITPSPALHNAPQLALANRLVNLSGLAQVHFSNSGSEANEVAIKLARKWARLHKPDATQIITTENAFHGRTLAMMAACGKPGWDDLFPPAMPGFIKAPYGEIDAVKALISEKTIAVMVEPIQGEAGVITPPTGYLRDLRKLADANNILLILDEVQTGVGRTGYFFASERENIKPDIVTLGKGLGGGVPISATLAAKNVCCFDHGDQGGTYNGNPLMTAVALEVVNTVCQSEFLANVRASGTYLQQHLLRLAETFAFKDVRGSGLLWGVDLANPCAASIQQHAFDSGLLVNAPRPGTLRFMPALNVSFDEIDTAMTLLKNSLESASQSV